jgi:hypothetical protein
MNLTAPPPQIEHHRVIESGVGACVDLCWSRTPAQSPAHPKPAAVGIAKARPRLSAHAYRQAREATPPAKTLVTFVTRFCNPTAKNKPFSEFSGKGQKRPDPLLMRL